MTDKPSMPTFAYLNRMMEQEPRWEHDCSDCTWLGPFEGSDLYACISGYGPDNLKIDTVIARYGTDGEYVSGLSFIDRDKRLGTAYGRALDYILQVQMKARTGLKPPSVPNAIELDAFNLWLGATFMENGRVYVVVSFLDYGTSEKIFVDTRRGDDDSDDTVYPFLFHYCDKVNVIGNVRNPQDFDDNNWGNDS
jgi:hypothetical protein